MPSPIRAASPDDDAPTSFSRLKAAIAAATTVNFWRNAIAQGIQKVSPKVRALTDLITPSPAQGQGLDERWSTSRLLAALPSPTALLRRQFSASTNASVSEAAVSPAPLSGTWSPRRLGEMLSTFRMGIGSSFGGGGGSSSSSPANSGFGSPPAAFTTWCDFHEDSLHHPAWGYYSDGRVEFGEEVDTSDFTTFPVTMRPAFGAMLADRIYSLWQASRGLGLLPAGSGSGGGGGGFSAPTFFIVELGAGTGVLAHDILSHLESIACAECDASLVYVIGERSASLRLVQEETNARFVRAGKLRVVPADARDLKGSMLRETLMGLTSRAHPDAAAKSGSGHQRLVGAVLSNELPDAFGVERVLVSRDYGRWS